MDEDRAIVQAAADGGQGAGIVSDCETPFDFTAGGLCDLSGDCLEFGKIDRRPIARIRILCLRRSDFGGCYVYRSPLDVRMPGSGNFRSRHAKRASHQCGGERKQSGKISVSEWLG